jgi:hypothetical protein
MNIQCELVLNECLPCNDDPIRNISAEDPDVNVFIGFADFRNNFPDGTLYAQIGCKRICFSAISQADANDCAIRQAKECVWDTGRPPVSPPIPPGPDGPRSPTTPGGISPPPGPGGNRLPIFRNRRQSCTVFCPDGTPFVQEVPAGVIAALNQDLADAQARSLACNRANQNRLCIVSDLLPGICVGTAYSFTFEAIGGLPFSDGGYIWNHFGDLPPGLALDGGSGVLSGTPTSPGDVLFQIEVFDANGNATTNLFSVCVMEIVTESALPNATEGDDYTQPLLEEPGDVASEVWTLVSGTLPPGLTLNATGSITGTPEENSQDNSPYSFTVRVVATCGTGSVTCQKAFTLEVEPPVDCMGEADAVEDLVWSNISTGTISNIAGGDGTYQDSGAGGIAFRALTELCNPSLDSYNVTITFDWSQTTNFSILGQALIVINGVSTFGTVQTTTGVFQEVFVFALPSGVNTVEVRLNGSGVFVVTWSGTVTIRPLTPP